MGACIANSQKQHSDLNKIIRSQIVFSKKDFFKDTNLELEEKIEQIAKNIHPLLQVKGKQQQQHIKTPWSGIQDSQANQNQLYNLEDVHPNPQLKSKILIKANKNNKINQNYNNSKETNFEGQKQKIANIQKQNFSQIISQHQSIIKQQQPNNFIRITYQRIVVQTICKSK